jgi:DNA polymerase-3 subunit delta'
LGAEVLARQIAAWQTCQAGGAMSCGVCADCRLNDIGVHPSVAVLQPQEGKRDIAVDDVRELCMRMAMTSHDMRPKVAVIDPADALNNAGVNALLKSIEEPASRNLFLLVTQRPAGLLATLRSRCQRLRLLPPPRELALKWLSDHLPDVEEETRTLALSQAGGGPWRACSLIREGTLDEHRRWQASWDAVVAGQKSPLAMAAEIKRPGETGALTRDSAVEFARWLAMTLHQRCGLLLQKNTAEGRRRARRDARRVQETLQAIEDLARHSASPQLTVDSLLLRACGAAAVLETVS